MNSKDLGTFLCGAAFGAAICAFMLPKSGSEYRELVKSKARDAAGKLRKGEEALLQRTSDLKATVGRHRTGIMEAVEAGRGAYQKATAVGNAISHHA